jgi:hypothetical protein
VGIKVEKSFVLASQRDRKLYQQCVLEGVGKVAGMEQMSIREHDQRTRSGIGSGVLRIRAHDTNFITQASRCNIFIHSGDKKACW